MRGRRCGAPRRGLADVARVRRGRCRPAGSDRRPSSGGRAPGPWCSSQRSPRGARASPVLDADASTPQPRRRPRRRDRPPRPRRPDARRAPSPSCSRGPDAAAAGPGRPPGSAASLGPLLRTPASARSVGAVSSTRRPVTCCSPRRARAGTPGVHGQAAHRRGGAGRLGPRHAGHRASSRAPAPTRSCWSAAATSLLARRARRPTGSPTGRAGLADLAAQAAAALRARGTQARHVCAATTRCSPARAARLGPRDVARRLRRAGHRARVGRGAGRRPAVPGAAADPALPRAARGVRRRARAGRASRSSARSPAAAAPAARRCSATVRVARRSADLVEQTLTRQRQQPRRGLARLVAVSGRPAGHLRGRRRAVRRRRC